MPDKKPAIVKVLRFIGWVIIVISGLGLLVTVLAGGVAGLLQPFERPSVAPFFGSLIAGSVIWGSFIIGGVMFRPRPRPSSS